jgi:hypothetical protein
MNMAERKYGVLIASSRFPDEPNPTALPNLRCPENDVDGLDDILRSPEHGQFSETFVLKNMPSHEVLRNINRVLWRAGKDDLVLIYYSGHGKLNRTHKLHLATIDTTVDELDTTSIPIDKIKDLVDGSHSKKVVLILDCCFSGRAGDSFAKSGIDDQLQLVSEGRGTYIMTASTGIEVAQEKESDEYGIFTKHIIEGIRSGDADLDDDGRVSMVDLYGYVHKRVLEEGCQNPMKWDLGICGPLYITRSGKTSREDRCRQIRDIILELVRKKLLPNYIIGKAFEVISSDPTRQTEEHRMYESVLNKLLTAPADVGDFIERWHKVTAQAATSPLHPAEIMRSEPSEGEPSEPLRKITFPAEKIFTNSYGMQFAFIPPGTMQMGSIISDPD